MGKRRAEQKSEIRRPGLASKITNKKAAEKSQAGSTKSVPSTAKNKATRKQQRRGLKLLDRASSSTNATIGTSQESIGKLSMQLARGKSLVSVAETLQVRTVPTNLGYHIITYVRSGKISSMLALDTTVLECRVQKSCP